MNWFRRIFARQIAFIKNEDFIYFPQGTKHDWPNDKNHVWDHPKGYPYQIYGGKMNLTTTEQIWTRLKEVPGYKLTEDYYTDRLYFTEAHNIK